MWFRGTYDKVLQKMLHWHGVWIHGDAVRDEVMRIDVTAENGVVPITTVRRCYVPWNDNDLEIIISILKSERDPSDPKWKRLIDMMELTKGLSAKAKLLPGGARWTPMDFRLSDVQAVIEVMLEAKSGKHITTMAEHIAKQKQGQGLWE